MPPPSAVSFHAPVAAFRVWPTCAGPVIAGTAVHTGASLTDLMVIETVALFE